MTVTTRPVQLEDVAALTDLLRTNRDFLEPWEPVRGEDYFTEEGQLASIQDVLAAQAQGTTMPHVILLEGRIVGRITLNSIIRGAFQSCSLGYWVASEANGRGVASEAVRMMLPVAFDELDLHRIQAETLPNNVASQKVLQRNGFERYGFAPQYLRIAGRWQDHILYQRLSITG